MCSLEGPQTQTLMAGMQPMQMQPMQMQPMHFQPMHFQPQMMGMLNPMVGGGMGYGIFNPAVPPYARSQLLAQRNSKLAAMGANRPVRITSAVDAHQSEEAGSRLHLMLVCLDYRNKTGPEVSMRLRWWNPIGAPMPQ